MTNCEFFNLDWIGDDPDIPKEQQYKIEHYQGILVYASSEDEAVRLLLDFISS